MTNSEHMKNKQDALDALDEMKNRTMSYLSQLAIPIDAPVWGNVLDEYKTIRAALSPETQGGEAALQNNAQVDVEALWEDILENFDGHAESFSDVSLNILLYLQSKGHLRAIPEWMPIETAPKDGTRIDLYCKLENEYGGIKHKRMIDVQWGDLVDTLTGDLYQGWRMQYDAVWEITPTHWMPLPAAPQPKGE